ncbi:MAG: aminoglycoside phosphotransferase family protein [Thermoleophilia bacterium]|nr:aminoglycoside phosphotransferase family protein [Thermoleophilia bacterium]
MEEERDHYVLVPDASGQALLARTDTDAPTLPHVRGRPGAPGAVESVRRELGLESAYLRLARVLFDEGRKPIGSLHEFDAPSGAWSPPVGTSWSDLDRADVAALAPPELAGDVERWIAEQLGAPVPDARPSWSRPGWLAQASLWIRETATACGLRPTGDLEVVGHWPLSSVLRLETDGGKVFFKAVFPIFGHEPAVTAQLSARHPTLMPELLAIDKSRGWMLMRELQGTLIGDQDLSRWGEGLRAAASIHKAWIGRAAELLSLGVHDRTLQALERDLAAGFDAVELSSEDRLRLKASLPTFVRASAELGAGAVPETLVHGELHPWNVMATDEGVRIFDWSDSCVSHPFFDLLTYLERVDDEQSRGAVLNAYLEVWSDTAPMGELLALAACAHPLALMHHSISCSRILDAMEPADRWWFDGEPARLLLLAIERAEALSRSWDDH